MARPQETFNTGISKTVDWYLEHHAKDPAWGGRTECAEGE